MNRGFTLLIVAAMIAGIAVGLACNLYLDAAHVKSLADGLGLVTDIFLRLIKIIIAPLVFTTLVAGIAHMDGAAAIGKIGGKTMLWFIGASLVSLTLGLAMVHLIQPGAGLTLHAAASADPALATAGFSLKDFIAHLVPTSIVAAMAGNEILQIVVFACFFGTAMAAIPGGAPQVLALVEQVAAIMLKITGYVMLTAPLAVFAAIASTVATQGPGVLVTYLKFVGGFYLSLGLLWLLMFGVAAVLMRGRVGPALSAVRQPALLAFSTASSEAAYPRMLEELQKLGLPRQIVSFVLPLGYSFNLDGSMMYCTFATLFIAQAYHIALSVPQQITLLLLMMVTSKGMAGVPRASLVVIAAALPTFHLPLAGMTLIIAVDHLLDMGRSGTNVIGNSLACLVVSRWEGRFDPREPAPIEVAG